MNYLDDIISITNHKLHIYNIFIISQFTITFVGITVSNNSKVEVFSALHIFEQGKERQSVY